MSVSDQLSLQLSEILASRPGLAARELVGHLRSSGTCDIDKSLANRVLYANPTNFRYDGATPPRWFLVEAGVAAPLISSAQVSPAPSPVGPSIPSLYAWQAEALACWERRGSRGVIEAVTGTGKTMLGVVAAQRELKRGGRVLVLVPTIELQRQWQKTIQSQLPGVPVGLLGDGSRRSLSDCHVLVAVVNSARDTDCALPGTSGLLVADECHRYGAAANSASLKEHFQRRLGLSATFARSDNGHLAWLTPYFGGVVFSMPYERARKEHVIAPFKLALVGVSFSVGDEAIYQELSREVGKQKFRLVHECGVREEPFAEFMKETTYLSDHGAPACRRIAWRFLRAFVDRRRMLADAPIKLETLQMLAAAIQRADRTLIFGESIRGAQNASELLSRLGLSTEAIHSGLNREERRSVLSRFAAGRLRALAAPRVLDEGIDVPEADLGIIVAASKTERQMIQRMGRVLRRKADGRTARFAVLYLQRTSEDPAEGAHETYLQKMQVVADDVQTFSLPASTGRLVSYLNDFQVRGPIRQPVLAAAPRRSRDNERSSTPTSREHTEHPAHESDCRGCRARIILVWSPHEQRYRPMSRSGQPHHCDPSIFRSRPGTCPTCGVHVLSRVNPLTGDIGYYRVDDRSAEHDCRAPLPKPAAPASPVATRKHVRQIEPPPPYGSGCTCGGLGCYLCEH